MVLLKNGPADTHERSIHHYDSNAACILFRGSGSPRNGHAVFDPLTGGCHRCEDPFAVTHP